MFETDVSNPRKNYYSRNIIAWVCAIAKQHFDLNYNSIEQCFELINKDSLKIKSFSSVKFQFEWKLILEQIMFFEISNNFEGLSGDVNLQNPPTYVFNELILHNMTQNEIEIKQGSVIGNFKIQSLQQQFTYMPQPIDENSFNDFTNQS